MHIRGCVSTDTGKSADTCKDAAVLKIASSGRYGRIAFAVLCDGLDEADDAGKASTTVAERFAAWFHDELPAILQQAEADMRETMRGRASARVLTEVLTVEDRRRSYSREMFALAQIRIRKRLCEITEELSVRIAGYRRLHGVSGGCVSTCVLLMGGEYMLMHIGPSRAYLAHSEELFLLETLETEAGAETTPFGSRTHARPLFLQGTLKRDAGILLCSDAFVRRQDPRRFPKKINRCIRLPERRQEGVLRSLTRYVRRRGEDDNAFAVFLSHA